MVTDPVGDMITSIKNASRAGHESVSIPYSNLKNEIAQILFQGGFLGKTSKKGKKVKKILEIELLYKNGEPKIRSVKRISKPSRRVYWRISDLKSGLLSRHDLFSFFDYFYRFLFIPLHK